MLQNNNEKIEELARSFSFKLADKLEKDEIGLDEMQGKIYNFLILVQSGEVEKIEKFVDGV